MSLPAPLSPPELVAWTLLATTIAIGFVAWRPALVVRKPGLVLSLVGALTLAALACVVDWKTLEPRLWLDPSEEPLMVRGDPAREVYDLATRRFGGDDRYVVAIEGDGFFAPDSLASLRDLGRAIVQLPPVRRSESLVNANDFYFDAQTELIEIGDFLRTIPSDPRALAELRERALADPIYPKYLISPDGRALALDVSLYRMSDQEWIRSGADERIRELTAAALGEGRRAYFSGRPHIKARAYHQMVRDLLRLIPLAVAVATATAFALTGSLRTALFPLAVCLTGATWTAAALVATDTPLNLITLVLPSTLIALGGLYTVHVLGRHQVECEGGGDAREIALRTLRYTLLPVFVAGFTTCVGFAALLLAKTPATTELGLFAVFGIACVTLLSLTAVPAALAWLQVPAARRSRPPRAAAAIARLLDRSAALATRRSATVLALWALLSASAFALLWRVEVDTDYLTFFDRTSSVRRDFEAIHRLLGGPVPLYVTFEGDEEGVFRQPENLRALETISARLASVPGVDNTLSMVEPLRKLNRAFEGGDPAEERIPDTREAVSDLVFMIPKAQMRRFASSNHRAANVVVRTGEQGSRAIRDLEAAIHRRLAEEALVPSGIRTAVTGNAIVLNRSADRIATDQFRCVGFASAAILVLIWMLFRSPRLALLAMLPNWVPVLLFFGLLGAGAAPLSLPTGLIGSLSLGVAIDDSVHLLVSYRRLRRGGWNPEAAIAETLRRVGRPVIITSAMLVAGFLTISSSGFATLREFGLLTAATMLLCLVTDLLLLPALLVRSRV